MYQLEAFQNRTTVKEYIRDYVEGEGFLEFCEKSIGFGQIWSCPLYDFNPTSYGKKYKYLYLFGKRVIFDPEENHDKVWKKSRAVDKELERAKKKEREKYISEVCLMEKTYLWSKFRHWKESTRAVSVSLPVAVMSAADVTVLKRRAVGTLMRFAFLLNPLAGASEGQQENFWVLSCSG